MIDKFNIEVANISALPDEPTITSTELKATFDKAGVDLKNYINTTLYEAVNDIPSIADNLQGGTNMALSAEQGKLLNENKQGKIESGTTLPSSLEEGQLFILYK